MYLPPQVACSTLYVATDFVCFPGRAYACMHMAPCRLPHHTCTPDAASRIPRNQQKQECLTRARSPNIRPSTNPGVSISPAPTHHAPFRSSAGIRRASHAATAQTPVIMESLRPRSCLPACLPAGSRTSSWMARAATHPALASSPLDSLRVCATGQEGWSRPASPLLAPLRSPSALHHSYTPRARRLLVPYRTVPHSL